MEMDPGCMESIPFRKLVVELEALNLQQPIPAKTIALASYCRLFCDLAYDAMTTNRPGLLTASGMGLHLDSLNQLGVGLICGGRDVSWIDLYLRAGLLLKNGADYDCKVFTVSDLNKNTRGHYLKTEAKGGAISGFRRRQKTLEISAQSVAVGLAPEGTYRDGDGEELGAEVMGNAITLIKQIDCILNRATRISDTHSFPSDLVRVAAEATMIYGGMMVPYKGGERSALELACYAVVDERGEPDCPATTEQVLAKFETYAARALKKNGQQTLTEAV